MGRLGRVLSFARRVLAGEPTADTKTDLGGGDNVTAVHFAPAGDDAPPLAQDLGVLVPFMRTGGWAVVGYSDANNAGTASPGEKRIYSRDSGGALAASVYLENDGTITLDNGNGATVSISAANAITAGNGNGATVSISGAGEITADNGSVSMELTGAGAGSISNADGGIELAASGVVTINGVTFDVAGNVIGTEFTAGVISLTGHKHGGVTPGTGTSGTPVP